MSTNVIIECINWFIKVTDDNDGQWKPEIKDSMFEPRKPLKAALSISCISDAFLPAF
jgi:hypothetical protein